MTNYLKCQYGSIRIIVITTEEYKMLSDYGKLMMQCDGEKDKLIGLVSLPDHVVIGDRIEIGKRVATIIGFDEIVISEDGTTPLIRIKGEVGFDNNAKHYIITDRKKPYV